MNVVALLTGRNLGAAAAALVALIFAGCAVPPGIEGAPCPCPSGYTCDTAHDMCVRGTGPIGPPVTTPPLDPVYTPTCAVSGAPPPSKLTPTEYRHSVVDLLGVELTRAELPPEYDGPTGFINSADRVDTEEGLRGLAPLVAARAASTLQRPAACDKMLDDACGTVFIDGFARRAFRRPPDPADRARLQTAFDTAFARASTNKLFAGMTAVIEATVASEAFLRRRDLPGAARGDSHETWLDDFSLASRLATLLWRSLPDEELLAAASAGTLAKPQTFAMHATRMYRDPRTQRMLVGFFRDWLGVEEVLLERSALPGYNPAVRTGLLRSFDAHATQLIFRQDATFRTLWSTNQIFVNRELASFLSLPAPTTDWEAVTPAAGQIRRGLLTAPAVLMLHANDGDTNPVGRGADSLRHAFCVSLPPPPPGADATPPPVTAASTTRQRYENHRNNPACSVCHNTIDPIGIGLENYDGVGRWRTNEGDAVIDASGRVAPFDNLSGFAFTGPADIGDYLATSSNTQQCYARQWFRYTFGRLETDLDTCTLNQINGLFTDAGGRTQTLLMALARSDAFTGLRTIPMK